MRKISGIEEVARLPSSHYVESLFSDLQSKCKSFENSALRALSNFKLEMKESIASIIDTIHQNTGANVPLMESLERDSPTNGIMKWAIVDFEKRTRKSRDGELASIYSSPFYTSTPGYKMRLRLDINGRNEGFNSHISLFLLILPGEYDHILMWPLKMKTVTFKLLNTVDGDDFIVRFTSVNFDQPINEAEVGYAQFISQDNIQNGFVLDNSVFLKCEVQLA